MTVRIEVLSEKFNPWQEVVQFEAGLEPGTYGANAVFVGTMRDFNEGDTIVEMVLEHYPGMTERHLETLAHSVFSDFEVLDLLILHRVGEISPGDSIVLAAVWSAHRADAFEACETIIEYLKSKAPFWKKESLADGSFRWVEHNTLGPRKNRA